MADIEAYPPKSWAPQLRVRGTLTGKDLSTLKRFAVPGRGLTIDIRGVRVLTDGGCEALMKLGKQLSLGGRRLTILYPSERWIAERLEASGLLDDWRIDCVGASGH
jgi:hypothetical protein